MIKGMESSRIVPTQESEAIRNLLSAEAQEHFDDVYYKRKLGATPHIYAIGRLYVDVAQNAEKNGLTTADVIGRVQAITDFFVKLRGDSSTAIVSAMRVLTMGVEQMQSSTVRELSDYITAVNQVYNEEAVGWADRIMEYGYNLICDKKSMLLYDYSSLVCAMLKIAGDNGHYMDIYLPESRFLDGGKPFVAPCLKNGHRVHFFPDVAILYYMQFADLAMMGAETFFPNGGMVNTIGSELVALACRRYKKPLYIPTSLIKVDMLSIEGKSKRQLFRDLADKLAKGWSLTGQEEIDFVCPNLDIVPPELITAYITEVGVVPCPALFGLCSSFEESLNRKIRERMAAVC